MTAAIDLGSAFQALPEPAEGSSAALVFSALPIPDYPRHRIGKGRDGTPSLLLRIADRHESASPPPILLEHLTVQHDVDCVVTGSDGAREEGTFTVVRCSGSDRMLFAYFLRIASVIVAVIGNEPSDVDVRRAVDRLVELFRSMEAASRRSVQGLWAELLLIARSPNPSTVAVAWHSTPDDRYDFNAGVQRIEVKSAAGRVRQHHFSLEQLCAPVGARVLVASVLVERAGAGSSIGDLLADVRPRLVGDPNLLLHVDEQVALTLGAGWRQVQDERFDRELGEASLRFFEPASIPKVAEPVPHGVSEVRFRADLSECPSADLPMLRAQGGLFAAAIGH